MLTTTDKLHTFVLCTLDLSAVLANCLLVYAILTRYGISKVWITVSNATEKIIPRVK